MDPVFEKVWDDFLAYGRMARALHSIGPGLMHLVWVVSLADERRVVEAAARVQASLDVAYADLVPSSNLHVSIQGVDVPAEVWMVRREELFDSTQRVLAGFGPFTIRLRGVNSFSVATIAQVDDGGAVRALRARMRAGMPDWLGLAQDRMVVDGADTWLPHMSLAYYTGEHDNQAVVEAIRPLRETALATVEVKALTLITTPTLVGEQRWLWPVERVFPLV